MVWKQPSRIRRFSAVAGCVTSLLTLGAAVVIFAVPTLTPVGLLVAAVLSTVLLSLPVWAMGLAYSGSEAKARPFRGGMKPTTG